MERWGSAWRGGDQHGEGGISMERGSGKYGEGEGSAWGRGSGQYGEEWSAWGGVWSVWRGEVVSMRRGVVNMGRGSGHLGRGSGQHEEWRVVSVGGESGRYGEGGVVGMGEGEWSA